MTVAPISAEKSLPGFPCHNNMSATDVYVMVYLMLDPALRRQEWVLRHRSGPHTGQALSWQSSESVDSGEFDWIDVIYGESYGHS